MLNKKIAENLGPSAETIVSVKLYLIHRKRPYEITREQKYTTNANGELSIPNSSVLSIKYKADNGEQEFVPQNEVELRIKEILPQELSKYFFFDGERINNMSKELSHGKSEEFADAVKRLLGLSAFSNTLNHLYSKNSSNSVIKSYNNDYDAKANTKIAEYTEQINKLDSEISLTLSQKILITHLWAEESKTHFCLSFCKTLIASQTVLEGDDAIEHKSISSQADLSELNWHFVSSGVNVIASLQSDVSKVVEHIFLIMHLFGSPC